jgi:hypothetical protein
MLFSVRCLDGIDGVQMTMGGWKKTQFRLCVSEKARRRQTSRYHLLLGLAPCCVQGCTEEERCSDETISGSAWCHCHWSFHLNTVVRHTYKENQTTQNW